MVLLFIGPPASGKGTQAKLISGKKGFYHLSTGDLLRKAQKSDPVISEIMKKGDLVPDGKVIALTEKYIKENNLFDNLILDGSPRSLDQYIRLKNFFAENGRKIDAAIYIDISDEEAIKRISARRYDPKTGKIYNLITNPPGPRVKESDLILRDDDKPGAIQERLKVQKVPESLLQALKEDGILVEIDGERPIDEIFQDICTKLNI
ncbi:hypothetical protein A2771_02135 [Candidatus Woesebacteria bacterium RIFCSPHIGHO2_01_FULL_38_26b]|uniref:Adenylate kinase n=1 Tax=Candidatus Woesebacteria bacterium RIFCSPHIGHO2_01_FULL_38_26b TaxID=1802491 RepID=A0A1F7XWV9_9BACT|nr:MAG: hypothetical protein A2771_02135 [Candidatus Woesebacteria bacterium RIFCSPHIGHO2_01_FULL_38_26b]